VLVATSQLLTTGVDNPTCKNIVIARVVGSAVDFKQIIGRGTRIRDDCDKFYFNILDYTGSATRLFASADGESLASEPMVPPGKNYWERLKQDPDRNPLCAAWLRSHRSG
jgi:type I site-specific restriction endonuclease